MELLKIKMSHDSSFLAEYSLQEVIHSSKSSLVYRGSSTAAQPVIVKLAKSISNELLINYSCHYTIANQLDLGGIVQPLRLYNSSETLAVIMADDNLVSLHSYLKAISSTSSEIKPLSLEAFFPIALTITDLIIQLHQHQIIHRQLNLSHLLINPQTQQIQLTDFSQAWQFPLTTSPYAPPEAVTASTYYNYDLYSLGVIFTQLLTGKIPPVESYPQSLKIADIPHEIAKILLKLTTKNPGDRYDQASDLKEDLNWCWQEWQSNSEKKSCLIHKQLVGVSCPQKWQKDSKIEPILVQHCNFLELILDNIPQGIFWKDRNSHYLGCNRQFLEDAGLNSEKEIIGKTDYDLPWTTEEADLYRKCDRKIMESGIPEFHIMETQRQSNGNICWVETNKIPLRDNRGNIIGILGTYKNITERKQAIIALENQLKQITLLGKITQEIRQSLNTEEIFAIATREIRSLLQADRVGIFQLFEDSNYTEGEFVAEDVASEYPSALSINVRDRCFGADYASDYTQGKIQAITDIYQVNLSDCHLKILAQFQVRANLIIPLLQGTKLWGLLCIHQCSSSRNWQEAEITFVQKIANQLSIALYQAELLAKAKQQQELLTQQNQKLIESKQKAEAANQAKTIFLANMSHELRTPLNAILGFSHIMKKDTNLSAKQQETINIINRSGEHLLNLINDVLEVSKIEAGQVKINYTNCDLFNILKDIQKMFTIKAKSKQLDLTFTLADNLPRYIKIDESKLRQILINLLSNAIKFTARGSVSLEASLQKSKINHQQILFIIKDTGIGISKSEIATIFAPFVQSKSGIKSQEGTGLGLTICQKFIKLMGGDIALESEINQGTTVEFAIPYNKALKTILYHQENPRVIGLKYPQKSYRILIVEDILENRQLLAEILKSVGFSIKEAHNGKQAISLWQKWQPDLIWMDIKMPIMNGYEAIKYIRKQEKIQNLKPTIIIALTAHVFEEQKTEILSIGCNDFVNKPFAESMIFDKMHEHLKVEFLYESKSSMTNPTGNKKTIFAQQELIEFLSSASISEEWINRLHYAAIKLDEELMLKTIQEIELNYQDVAQTLIEWLNSFQFDLIAAVTENLKKKSEYRSQESGEK